MRLTVDHLKPWIVTALVVLVILLAGGIYLTRTALRGPPLAGPSWAPGRSPGPPSGPPSVSPTGTRRPRSGTSSSPTRTTPTSAATTTPGRTSPPPPVTVPHVLVAGPTIDNLYPNDAGCHVFWMTTPGLRATITDVSFRGGPITTFVSQPSGDVPPMRVNYVACDRTAPAPLPAAGCGKGQVISTERSCGVRFTLDQPRLYGIYQGVLSFDMSVLCTGAEATPCAQFESPYRPSADRPLYADWSTDCQIRMMSDSGGADTDPNFSCRLAPA